MSPINRQTDSRAFEVRAACHLVEWPCRHQRQERMKPISNSPFFIKKKNFDSCRGFWLIHFLFFLIIQAAADCKHRLCKPKAIADSKDEMKFMHLASLFQSNRIKEDMKWPLGDDDQTCTSVTDSSTTNKSSPVSLLRRVFFLRGKRRVDNEIDENPEDNETMIQVYLRSQMNQFLCRMRRHYVCPRNNVVSTETGEVMVTIITRGTSFDILVELVDDTNLVLSTRVLQLLPNDDRAAIVRRCTTMKTRCAWIRNGRAELRIHKATCQIRFGHRTTLKALSSKEFVNIMESFVEAAYTCNRDLEYIREVTKLSL
jgi:hypothetical protein